MRTIASALLFIIAAGHAVLAQQEVKSADLAPVYIDLSKVANMGFSDDKSGDGKGGWSDQGPGNDYREFNLSATQFGGAPFRIIDPAANDGKSVLSFRHESYPAGLTSVTASLPAGSSGRYLYLLHTSSWNGQPKGTSIGTIKLTCRDGSVQQVDIQSKRDIADWWNPMRLPNGVVVAAKPNQSSQVGVYLSRFDLGKSLDVQSVTFTTTEKVLWIVVAATLTGRDVPLPEEKKPLTINADANWKALPDKSLVVKAGTALDCSAWVDHAPAGTRGRVIARPDGTLAFADQPDRPVRFFCVSGFPTKNPEDIEALADTIVRQGYNLVRLHFMDQFIAGQMGLWGKKLSQAEQVEFDRKLEAGEPFLKADKLDVIDRFVAALRKRGVYLYLDALSSWTGCYPANCWYGDNGVGNLKTRLFYDPVARRHWHNTVKTIFTRINPYTKTCFATDPQVIAVLGMNEPTLSLDKKETAGELAPTWRAFLARRFTDFATYKKAWGKLDPSVDSIDKAPFFTQGDSYDPARGRIVGEYLNQLEEETSSWMQKELKSFGYEGIFTEYDWLNGLRFYLPRAKTDMLSMHGYFAHPHWEGEKIKMSHNSSLSDALNWWRGIAAVRIAGKPLAVMEYGHVFWNSYRYEEGLAVGAYGSLQDMSILTGHSWPVAVRPEKMGPFNIGTDPVARASQVVTGLMFMGREVAVAPHRVDIPISRELALNNSEMAISGDQSRIGLLTGFATEVEGHTSSIPATLRLPMGDGAKTMDAAFYSTVIDSEGGTFDGAVNQLRSHGILPKENRTDAKKKIYESETGEILLDANKGRLSVSTPKLASLCTDKIEEPMRSGKLTVEKASYPAAFTVAARDGKALELSARLLLVIATDARNSGVSYEDAEGVAMVKTGDLPALMHTGQFTVVVERAAKAPVLRAWALAMDGTRCDELPVKTTADGLRMEIDTAAWACGPSPFIELAEK